MSAHFNGGAEIAGRRLRDVIVRYVDDPTLDLDAQDSDSCPPSPPPTYYLRVREEKQRIASDANSDSQEQGAGPTRVQDNKTPSAPAWSWRYVNVEKKLLLVWNRRGGKIFRSIPLIGIESLRVVSDQDSPGSILEVRVASSSSEPSSNGPQQAAEGRACERASKGLDGAPSRDLGMLVLQARSRRETLLWAKVLQENVEHMTKRVIPLENLDEETTLSDVQELAKLLTHQLSALQVEGNSWAPSRDSYEGSAEEQEVTVSSSPEADASCG